MSVNSATGPEVRPQTAAEAAAAENQNSVEEASTSSLTGKLIMVGIGVCGAIVLVNIVAAVANAIFQTMVYVIAGTVIIAGVSYFRNGSVGVSGIVTYCGDKLSEIKDYAMRSIGGMVGQSISEDV